MIHFKYYLLSGETITVTPTTDNIEVTLLKGGGDVLGSFETYSDGGTSGDSLTYTNELAYLEVYVKIEKQSGADGSDYTATVGIE